MRRRRQKRGASVLLPSLAVSIAVHLILGINLKDLFNGLFTGPVKDAPVRVVQLSPGQWSKNFETKGPRKNPLLDKKPQALGEAERARREAEKKKEEEEKKDNGKLDGQIVEVPPTRDDSANPDAKYLSKYNSHVDKETVARMEKRDSKLKRVTNELQTTKRQEARPQPGEIKTNGLEIKGGDGLQKDKAGAPDQKKFKLEVPDILKRDALDLNLQAGAGPGVHNRSASEALKGNSEKFELSLGGNAALDKKGEAGGKAGPKAGSQSSLPTLSALLPNMGTLARISGSPSRDYVEGVEEGDGTFLNTKEFKYATFFYRVRDSVADHWEDLAAREYRRRDPTGNIYGLKDRATLLHIELNLEGEIAEIRVERTSGVDFLDEVAVEAFKKAQPFPNPPAGIADADGQIRFNFQFIITMNSGRNIFRGLR